MQDSNNLSPRRPSAVKVYLSMWQLWVATILMVFYGLCVFNVFDFTYGMGASKYLIFGLSVALGIWADRKKKRIFDEFDSEEEE